MIVGEKSAQMNQLSSSGSVTGIRKSPTITIEEIILRIEFCCLKISCNNKLRPIPQRMNNPTDAKTSSLKNAELR